jgi:hypothetical protein
MHEIALRLAAKHFDKRLIENSFRSALVEEMIDPFLSVDGWRYTGDGWSGLDFERSDGARLEVKQSAAHQTWSVQRSARMQGRFDIAPRTGFFDNGGSRWTASVGRPAHVYIFAWNGTYGEETDHRNQDQWEFYVVPTSLLPTSQKIMALSGVRRLASQAINTARFRSTRCSRGSAPRSLFSRVRAAVAPPARKPPVPPSSRPPRTAPWSSREPSPPWRARPPRQWSSANSP